MDKKLQIPEEYTHSFKQIVNRLPERLRNDSETLSSVLLFLKLGKTPLARHVAQTRALRFRDRVILPRRPLAAALAKKRQKAIENAANKTPGEMKSG